MPRLNDPNDPRSLSSRFRARRAPLLRHLLRSGGKVIDLGGTPEYWLRIGRDFLKEHRIEVTILNYSPSELGKGPFATIRGDACAVDLPDMSFDFVHSNSVIEHVGDWDRMQMFASEVRRLAPAHYVQTPNYWFPIEPHFYKVPMFHWLPEPSRAWLLRRMPIAHSGRIADRSTALRVVRGSQLLTAAEMKQLFPESNLVRERVMGLTKSLILTRSNGGNE